MKKFSLFALAMCTGLAMFAQESTTPMAVKPRLGIKAGVNLAELRPHDEPNGVSFDNNMKTSMNGGIFFNAPLGTGGLSIQPELLYSGQGSKITQKTTVGPATATNTYEQDLHYITLPVMFQWKSMGGFFIELGPQAGYLLSAKAESNNTETDNESSFKKWDVAAAGGIGYLSRIGLGINARYVHGLMDVLDKDMNTTSLKMKNQVIQIGLSWSFGAGK